MATILVVAAYLVAIVLVSIFYDQISDVLCRLYFKGWSAMIEAGREQQEQLQAARRHSSRSSKGTRRAAEARNR